MEAGFGGLVRRSFNVGGRVSDGSFNVLKEGGDEMSEKVVFDFVHELRNQLEAIEQASKSGVGDLIRLNLNKALATAKLLEDALMHRLTTVELTNEEKKIAVVDQFRATKMLYQRIRGDGAISPLGTAKGSVEAFILLGEQKAKALADTSN